VAFCGSLTGTNWPFGAVLPQWGQKVWEQVLCAHKNVYVKGDSLWGPKSIGRLK